MAAPILELKGIERSYSEGEGRLTILKDAGFTLRPGEMVALVAPSGAGKSTLLHLAGLLEAPDAGEVIVAGQACGRLSDDARTAIRRNEIGFVYQFHHLLPEFTAEENVMIPQMVAGMDPAEAKTRASQLLDYLRVGHRGSHRPAELSGGEQQRVAIARAVANAPRVLLADEPTGNLDTERSHEIMELLTALNREHGLTIVMVTHEPDIAAFAGRQIGFRDGRIAFDSATGDAA